jgi:glycosyltransferase involved in cell wall biosynthesis
VVIRLGIVRSEDTWRFFEGIFHDLAAHYPVDVFSKPSFKSPILHHRLYPRLLRRRLHHFLGAHDGVLFEWASELLVEASHLPKTARIIARLHRYELFTWAPAINWSAVDQIILVSHAMQAKFAQRFPAQAHKTTVVPEGIDVERFPPIVKPVTGDIGILCNLTPRKRVYELILAFSALRAPGRRLHLHIGGAEQAGSEDYYDALNTLVVRLGLECDVTFYGEVQRPWEWYPTIDVFVSNSYSEGLQVAPMEAMASGRHCLAHVWDGADELVPKEQLFATDAELQAKLCTYLTASETEQRDQQDHMAVWAREHFALPGVTQHIRGIIEDVARYA